jgi:hypothetical protein
MPFEPRIPLRRASLKSVGLLTLCFSLSACGGGGGGGIASIPPPPPPPPTGASVTSIDVQKTWLQSPATRAGSYDLIATFGQTRNGTFGFAGSNEFQLNISKPDAQEGFAYALGGPSSFLPDGLSKTSLPVPAQSWDFNAGGPNYRYDNPYGDSPQFFGENLKEYEVYSDGSTILREDYDFDRAVVQDAIVDVASGHWINESLVFDAGLSYVAMGEWSWGPMTVSADGTATTTGDRSTIYFVYGDRTPASGIPASGAAIYDAHSLGGTSNDSLSLSLTADFGQRSISAEIRQASLFDVSGSAPFSNDGSFDIPLSGTAGQQAATGAMDGAFFGPHAEEVGGVFAVQRADGVLLMQDAFVGQQPRH